jgi:hypothetical protein
VNYCDPSDIYAYGVPRGTTPNPGRVCAEFETNVVVLDVHGFAEGDAVIFRPAGAATMPVGLVEGTTYYASPISESSFALKDAPGGIAVTFTASLDPVLVVSPLPIAEAIAWASRVCDDSIPAHAMPLDDGATVPEILRYTCAELAAGKLLAVMGASSTSLAETIAAAARRLERWGKGVPMRGADVPTQTNLTVTAVATAAPSDPRGWRRFGGL